MNPLKRYQLTMGGIDALQAALAAEVPLRRGRTFEEWSKAEAQAVWTGARDFAQQHGLHVPLFADVVRVERLACGHSDYSSKWALYVTELMMASEPAAA